MKQHTKLEKAKAILVLDQPFFAALLFKYPLVEKKEIKSMNIDKRGQISYNPEFCESLSVPQLVFALAHEVMHRIGQHANRLNGRDKEKWNHACDMWINDTLEDAKVGETIPGMVTMAGARDKSCDELYNMLPPAPPKGDKGKGDGSGDGDGDPLGGDIEDNGEGDLTEEESRAQDAQMKVDVAQAANAAKMRGKLPGSLARFAEDLINVKTPWYDILERFMTSKVRNDQSWKRPNRRFIGQGLYLPVMDSVGVMGEVVIGVDTSGSIGQEELNEFSSHLNRILEQCNPTKVHVVYCDSRIAHVDEFTPEDFPIVLKPHGGGGTDMREIVEWTKHNADEAECLIILSDLYSPFPSYEVVPTIWASTSTVAAPPEAGQTVFLRDR